MKFVARDYIEEKLRKAKTAVIDAENELARLQDVPGEPGFIQIKHDSQIDVDTRFAVEQLNAVRLNVDKKTDGKPLVEVLANHEPNVANVALDMNGD